MLYPCVFRLTVQQTVRVGAQLPKCVAVQLLLLLLLLLLLAFRATVSFLDQFHGFLCNSNNHTRT